MPTWPPVYNDASSVNRTIALRHTVPRHVADSVNITLGF